MNPDVSTQRPQELTEQMPEQERFGTASAWAETLGVTAEAVRKRLRGINGITARDIKGRTHIAAFYAESDVRRVCADLLSELRADDNGFLHINDIRYGSIAAWAEEFRVSPKAVRDRISGLQGITARSAKEVLMQEAYFPEPEVRERCAVLLNAEHRADKQGFFTVNREDTPVRYGHLFAWAKEIEVDRGTIETRLKGAETLQGTDADGRERAFYAEPDVLERCKEICAELPTADASGFLQHEGKRHATIATWSNLLRVDQTAIRPRLEGAPSIRGRDMNRRIRDFYSESIVDERCGHFRTAPSADEDGFVRIGETRYCHVTGWSEELGIEFSTLLVRLREVPAITARDKNGRMRENGFYAEDEVRRRCKEHLRDLPKADKSGFFTLETDKGVVRYATSNLWAETLEVSKTALAIRLRKLTGITGKDMNGHIIENGFYPESEVREVCADLLSGLPQADAIGFFETDGIRYGTKTAWWRTLGISDKSIEQPLKPLAGITGRAVSGQVCENAFFAEPDVLRVCAHLLEEIPQAGQDGFFEREGVRYAYPKIYAALFGVAERTVLRRIGHLTGITGKDFKGHRLERKFFPEPAVQEACKDLIVPA